MGFFAGVTDLEHRSGDNRHLDHVEGGRVYHHRRVHAGERPSFQEQDLTAGVADLLGGGADHTHRQTDLVGYPCGGDAGSHGHSGDDVMTAGVANTR